MRLPAIIAISTSLLLGCGEQEFNLCTYNIKGLPSEFTDHNPEETIPEISERINEMNENGNSIDILLVQENFMPNYKFLINTNYPNKFPVPQLCINSGYETDWENCQKLLETDDNYKEVKTNSGLSSFSFFPMSKPYGWAWGDKCHGNIDSGYDCSAPKGVSVQEIEIMPNVAIDVYNLHADAGDNLGDQNVRNLQFKLLAKWINQRSSNKAVIVTGDFNEYKPQTLSVLKNIGLIDLCDLYME